jgi:putative phosphoserine phosphatase/1-acylglycerol-3-phosphate O-acyltransferase
MTAGSPPPAERPPLSRVLLGYFNLSATLLLATLFCALLFLVALFTLFQARRFYSEFCVRHYSRLMLWLARTPMRVHGAPAGKGPFFYMPNHPSGPDIFVVMALGLPNTRFFLSRGVMQRFPPLGLIAALMGVFFTPNQRDTPARIRCFERAYRHLAKSGESVLGSPEGQVVPGPEVGRFNRGVFHLATLLQVPIQPLYLYFPPGTSAGRGYVAASPEVDVYFLSPISTAGWRVEDIDLNKERVREVFLDFGRRLAEARGAAA